jgi:hypothetical protein
MLRVGERAMGRAGDSSSDGLEECAKRLTTGRAERACAGKSTGTAGMSACATTKTLLLR